jgi:hypothetical protein
LPLGVPLHAIIGENFLPSKFWKFVQSVNVSILLFDDENIFFLLLVIIEVSNPRREQPP